MNTNVIQQTIAIVAIPSLIITVIAILCQWKILSKAGKPGWFSIIPILNIISLYQVADALKFLLIQIVGSIVFFAICNIKGDIFLIGSFICLFAIIISSFALPFKLAKKFNKGTLFGIVLMFLPIIGYPMLAFGKSQYTGKVEASQEDDPQEDTEEDDQEVPQDEENEIEDLDNETEEDLSEFTNENYVPEEDEENTDLPTEEENTEIEDLDNKEFIDPPVTIQDEEEPQVVDIDNEEDNSIEEENDAVDTIEQEEVDEDDEQQDEDSELETKEIDF